MAQIKRYKSQLEFRIFLNLMNNSRLRANDYPKCCLLLSVAQKVKYQLYLSSTNILSTHLSGHALHDVCTSEICPLSLKSIYLNQLRDR